MSWIVLESHFTLIGSVGGEHNTNAKILKLLCHLGIVVSQQDNHLSRQEAPNISNIY
jgi:hypothetical protein